MASRRQPILTLLVVLGLLAGPPASAGAPPAPGNPPVTVPPVPPAATEVPEGSVSMGGPDQIFIGLAGQSGGIAAAVTKRDNNLFVGMGPRMAVLDVTNPAAPVMIARSVVLSSTIRWIHSAPTITGAYPRPAMNYVLDTQQVRVFDMSSPTIPTLLGSAPIPGDVSSGVYSTTGTTNYWLWVAAGAVGGVIAVNVSNPAAPVVHNSTGYNSPGQALAIARSGNYVYLADGTTGMRVVSVANPTTPSPRGGAGGLQYESFRSIAVFGQYAYVGTTFGRFIVFDVSNPDAPVQLGFVYMPRPDWIYSIYVVNGVRAYLAGDYGGLFAVDISNPAAPVVIGDYNTPGRARGVWVSNNIAYVADFYGMRAFDVTPAIPAQLGVFPALGNSQAVSVAGDYAYVADAEFGTRIVSLADLSSPLVVGSYNVVTTTQDIVSDGIYAYMVAGSNGLHVLNVTNPTAPTRCGLYSNPSGMFANSVAKQGDYVYIADLRGYLRVVDINPCNTTQEVGVVAITGATAVTVAGQYAYVAAGGNGLVVVNISSPISPYVVGSTGCSTTCLGNGVAILGTTVFMSADPGGLFKFDVSNPVAPTQIASTATLGAAQDVAVQGDYAFVADASKGLHVYAATQGTLADLGYWDTAGQANGVTAVAHTNGVHAFIADRAGGMYVMQVAGEVLNGRLMLPLIRRNAPPP